ncbi:unnamed protein product [Bursaphelenchus xylophilus]|uniref:(pine wood nematode) hypothetical protein n=1 Tax=Bursaphelenchus xylophilus TaxID=6326 RepID=A0A7I8XPA4_BURXY|nr:unnamed protein product [Bursaphelenchus xylophilus]CAG9080849.1 unnamed protein product [Bursaphelenchus xylophilus]
MKRVEIDRDPVIPLTRLEQTKVLTISDSFLATVRYLGEKLSCSESSAQDILLRLDQLAEPRSTRDHERFALAKRRGIWFVTGTLEKSELPEAERHPIFLAKSSRILLGGPKSLDMSAQDPVVAARMSLAKQMNLPISHFSSPECFDGVMKCLQKQKKKGISDPIQCCQQCS